MVCVVLWFITHKIRKLANEIDRLTSTFMRFYDVTRVVSILFEYVCWMFIAKRIELTNISELISMHSSNTWCLASVLFRFVRVDLFHF